MVSSSPFLMPTNVFEFLKFQRDQNGILPPHLAAQYLAMSRQGLLDAANAKKIAYQMRGKTRYYGYNSLRLYKEMRTARDSINRSFGEN